MAAHLPRHVEVLHDGQWLAGWVHAVRRDTEESWLGLVTYYDQRWLRYYHWRPDTENCGLSLDPNTALKVLRGGSGTAPILGAVPVP